MAESKRRGGEDAVGERLDEAFDDAVDDDTPDAGADDVVDDEPVSRSSRRSAAATRDRVEAPKTASTGKSVKTSKGTSEESVGLFGRIARFVREVVAELRKVNWPSRNELITYTAVVVIFVVIMMAIVAGLDYGFAWGVGKVFGGK